MDVKIIHHPANEDSIRCAKELQGLLPFESNLHAGPTSDSLPRNDYVILENDEWDQTNNPPNPFLLGNMLACFYAHYTIWEKITENTLIFEDDARQINSYDVSILENFDGDVLNLGAPINCGKSNNLQDIKEMRLSKHKGVKRRTRKGSFLYGAHAYLLTPKGAEKLLKVSDFGRLLRPNDVMCQVGTVDLFDYFPHPFHQDPQTRESTIISGIARFNRIF